MRRWLPRILGTLTFVTALLPFFLHHALWLSAVKPTTSQDENVWKRPVEEVVNTAKWTLFYHVYFPPNSTDGYRHAASIVQEQIGMLGQSFATKAHAPILYYTVIGEKLYNQTAFFHNLCRINNLKCIPIGHYLEGQEDLTLQSVYNFCQAVPSQSVVYLHSKGSFHAEGPKFSTQDVWRQRLTEAATSQQCLEALTQKEGQICETCSLLLQPLPGIHYPGNMWGARCTHVRRLLPPNSFAKRMDKVVNAFKVLRDTRKRLDTTFFPQMPHMMGRKRFAAEHWIGSHPALLYPCDVSSKVTANMSEWLHPSEFPHLSSSNFRLGMSPTFPMDYEHWDYFRYGKRGKTVLETPALRLRDYFLLPGQLLKWVTLYGQAPPPESWIWTWFPDGQVWEEKISLYGLDFWTKDTDTWLPKPVTLGF